MAEGAMICIKFFLFFVNFIVWLGGCGLLGFGIYMEIKSSNYGSIFGNYHSGALLALMVVGSVIFIVAFLGCCGSLQESPCMLFSFAIILLGLFITTLVLGIVAYINKDAIKENAHDSMLSGMGKYYETHTVKAWDDFQETFKCCGTDNYTDWINTGRNFANDSNNIRYVIQNVFETDYTGENVTKEVIRRWIDNRMYKLPNSCCIKEARNCTVTNLNQVPEYVMPDTKLITFDWNTVIPPATLQDQGCLQGYIDFINKNINLFIGIIVTVMVVQLLDIVFAILFGIKINQALNSPSVSFRGSSRKK